MASLKDRLIYALGGQPPEPMDTNVPELPHGQRHGGSFATGLIDSAVSGFTLPRDVYEHGFNPEDEEFQKRLLDLAGLPALEGGAAFAATGGAGPDGTTLGIVPVPVARRIDMPVTANKNQLLLDALGNSPSARMTDDGLEIALQRMQKPAQSGAESVRTGVFYLPEGSAQMRYYTNHRPTEVGTYGGQEAIRGTSLYKNPIVAKGGTGGKVPEAAYDALMGKGAYQDMRQEALQAIPPYGVKLDYSDRAGLVDRFLKDYAPDLYETGFADHILENSKGGNLLPYALQELAVADAARNAGHDAVIGVTRAKAGPTISEIFDLRERSYPTPEGDFDLMPYFQNRLK